MFENKINRTSNLFSQYKIFTSHISRFQCIIIPLVYITEVQFLHASVIIICAFACRCNSADHKRMGSFSPVIGSRIMFKGG